MIDGLTINGLNQFIALLGSQCYIFYLILRFENKWNKNKKLSWRTYFGNNWIDFTILAILGQILTLIQEYIFAIYVVCCDENGWDWFYDIEEGISFMVGIFGLHIFRKVLGLGEKGLNKI